MCTWFVGNGANEENPLRIEWSTWAMAVGEDDLVCPNNFFENHFFWSTTTLGPHSILLFISNLGGGGVYV